MIREVNSINRGLKSAALLQYEDHDETQFGALGVHFLESNERLHNTSSIVGGCKI